MPKIIVHPGFHKTGTTFVQNFLMKNGPVLWPVTALGMEFKMRPAIEAAKLYSLMPNPKSLDQFRLDFRDYLSSVEIGKHRSLVISAEGLSGNMPGRYGVEDFHATADLQKAVVQELTDHFGGSREIIFYFSTRNHEAWLKSAYWQTLRATFLEDDWDTFLQNYKKTASLEASVEKTIAALDPIPVITHPLEKLTSTKFGPATPIIDLLELDQDRRGQLSVVTKENSKPPQDVIDAFLQINRGPGQPEQKHAEKTKILDQWRKQET